MLVRQFKQDVVETRRVTHQSGRNGLARFSSYVATEAERCIVLCYAVLRYVVLKRGALDLRFEPLSNPVLCAPSLRDG